MSPSATIRRKAGQGNALLLAMIFTMVIAVLLLALYDFSGVGHRAIVVRTDLQDATRLAEAGIEKAVWCLNNPSNTTNCPGNPNYTGETGVALGDGSFSVQVTGSGSSRTVVATGSKGAAAGPVTKQLEVKLTTTSSEVAFQYGVQAGIGGIVLDNNSHIVGNVFSSGSVTGSNGSSVTGDAVLTVNNPTVDVSSSPSVSPLELKNFGDASGNTYVAQRFIASNTNFVYSLDLKIAKRNAPNSTVTAYFYDDNAGAPGSNLSGSGQQLTVSVPNETPAGWENGWTTQNFTPSTTLVSGSTYWLVLEVNATNSSKYWVLAKGNDATYGDGTAKSGASLAALSPACAGGCDIAFRINVGGIPPTLKVPSVLGNAYARTISDTTIGKKAYYQNLDGTVKANGGNDACTTSSTGPWCFGNQPDQTPQPFPLSEAEITQMEGQAANGGSLTCSPTCTITDGMTIGPKAYVGDVVITNGAVVTLAGTIWVQGNLTVSNDAILRLSSGYGEDSGVIIADSPTNRDQQGLIIFSNNGQLEGNGTGETYIMAVSMNADSAFNATAIDVANNLTAGVLYAPFGKVNIANNAHLKEVTAQKLVLANNATVEYETGLASVIFSSGPGGSWTLQKGTYKIE